MNLACPHCQCLITKSGTRGPITDEQYRAIVTDLAQRLGRADHLGPLATEWSLRLQDELLLMVGRHVMSLSTEGEPQYLSQYERLLDLLGQEHKRQLQDALDYIYNRHADFAAWDCGSPERWGRDE